MSTSAVSGAAAGTGAGGSSVLPYATCKSATSKISTVPLPSKSPSAGIIPEVCP
ncbi:MAG: hypothetical protein ACYC35_06400 [Pirellulales bacterium]